MYSTFGTPLQLNDSSSLLSYFDGLATVLSTSSWAVLLQEVDLAIGSLPHLADTSGEEHSRERLSSLYTFVSHLLFLGMSQDLAAEVSQFSAAVSASLPPIADLAADFSSPPLSDSRQQHEPSARDSLVCNESSASNTSLPFTDGSLHQNLRQDDVNGTGHNKRTTNTTDVGAAQSASTLQQASSSHGPDGFFLQKPSVSSSATGELLQIARSSGNSNPGPSPLRDSGVAQQPSLSHRPSNCSSTDNSSGALQHTSNNASVGTRNVDPHQMSDCGGNTLHLPQQSTTSTKDAPLANSAASKHTRRRTKKPKTRSRRKRHTANSSKRSCERLRSAAAALESSASSSSPSAPSCRRRMARSVPFGRAGGGSDVQRTTTTMAALVSATASLLRSCSPISRILLKQRLPQSCFQNPLVSQLSKFRFKKPKQNLEAEDSVVSGPS